MIRRIAVLALLASGLGAWPAVAQDTAGRADRDQPIARAASAADVCAALSNRMVGGSRLAADLVPATAAAPVYCRVRGTIAPRLNFEIRLPQTWNRRLYYGGGGGYNGVIPELVVAPLKQGYAQVVSDSGHQDPTGMSAAFVQNDPAAARLFGSEAVPTVMAATLQILTAAYGVPPSKSYFESCSTGGREALMAVQRNPGFFDGVIARAPAFNWVAFMGAFQATARAAAVPGGSFSSAKAALLARHVRRRARPDRSARCARSLGHEQDCAGVLLAEKFASQGAPARSLPLCPFPQYPHCTGPADNPTAARQAANFTCMSPGTVDKIIGQSAPASPLVLHPNLSPSQADRVMGSQSASIDAVAH